MLSAPFGGSSKPSQLAVVAILAGLLSFSASGLAEPAISCQWESFLAHEIPTGVWLSEIDATVAAGFDSASASVRLGFEDVDWTKLEFEVVAMLGVFEIESDLRFEPDKDRFRDWITKVEWGDDTLAFALISKLTRTTDYLIVEVEREWAAVELEADARLRAPSGGCSYSFYDASLDLEFMWCGIETDVEFEIDDDGLDEAALELSDLVIGTIPWVTFDMEIEWSPQETAIDLSADLALEGAWCGDDLTVELEADLPNAPSLLPVVIQEMAIEWSVDPWAFAATAILDPDEWIDDLYWLELETSAELPVGCWGELDVELVLLWDEVRLGWWETTVGFEPNDDLALDVILDFDLANSLLEAIALTVGITW